MGGSTVGRVRDGQFPHTIILPRIFDGEGCQGRLRGCVMADSHAWFSSQGYLMRRGAGEGQEGTWWTIPMHNHPPKNIWWEVVLGGSPGIHITWDQWIFSWSQHSWAPRSMWNAYKSQLPKWDEPMGNPTGPVQPRGNSKTTPQAQKRE